MPGYLGGVLRVCGLLDKALMGIRSFLESERAIFCDFLPLRSSLWSNPSSSNKHLMWHVTEIYRFGESLNADIFCLAFEGNNPAEETEHSRIVLLPSACRPLHLLGGQGHLSAPVPVQVLFLSLLHWPVSHFFSPINLESMNCFLNKRTIFIVQVTHGHLRKLWKYV